MRSWHIGLVALVPLWAAAGCGHGSAKAPRGGVERLPRLEVIQPTQEESLSQTVELAATVEALKKVDLCARVPGVVEHLPDTVDIGRPVAAGEVLVRLAVPDLEAERKHKETLLLQAQGQKVQVQEARVVAEREVEEAQKLEKRWAADYKFQQLKYDRQRELARRGAADAVLVQEAERQMEAALAAWEASQAQTLTRKAKARASTADLEVAERKIEVADAELHKVKTMIELATIKAPFNGILTRRWVDPGATIKDPAAPLLTVVEVDRVRVLIDIPQRDVPLVNTREQNPNEDGNGDPVKVRIPELADAVPGGEFQGFITRMGKVLDPATHTMRAEIELDNPKGHLRPGMYGTATVQLDKRYKAWTLPASALVRRSSGEVEVYYVADPQGDPLQGVLRPMEIKVGLDNGQRVEVRTRLTGNELIVLRGNGMMREGDKVIAVPPAAR